MTNLRINKVAVIGAGISGVCSAAHLLRQGLSVTVFERTSIAGGIWVFDERASHEYPNENPSTGDYERVVFKDEDVYDTPPRTPTGEHLTSDHNESLQNELDARFECANHASIEHASPGPCYVNLKNNVSSTTSMKTSLRDWPPGLEEFVSQRYFEEYFQKLALDHKVHSITRYNTRVEDVRKVGDRWRVCTTTLVLPDQSQASDTKHASATHLLLRKNISYFNAVVVAIGHNHMPRIPNIPGLAEAKSRYPDRINHSKGYRRADKYRGSKVLIIGAGVSSVDIAKEIVSVGGTVYQSSRGGYFDYPAKSLLHGAHRVPGIEALILKISEIRDSLSEESTESLRSKPQHGTLPIDVKLSNGETLTNIHFIIVATGYIHSYPFLPDKRSDTKTNQEADTHLLVTKEGDVVHNLYKDIFYIEDPTLSFAGMGIHISTFLFFDFQAQLVARVYSERSSAKIPSKKVMRAEYDEKVKSVGLGRDCHSFRWEGAEVEYVEELVELANRDLKSDEQPMSGHTDEFLVAYRKQREILYEKMGREALERRK